MARPLSFRAALTVRWTIAFGLLLACTSVAVYAGVRVYAQRDFDATLRTLAATEIASSTDAGGLLHIHELSEEHLGSGDFTGKFVQYYALDGSIAGGAYATDAFFGLNVPTAVPGVPAEVLNPRGTWSDTRAYDAQAAKLAAMFRENFARYSAEVDESVRAAAPKG